LANPSTDATDDNSSPILSSDILPVDNKPVNPSTDIVDDNKPLNPSREIDDDNNPVRSLIDVIDNNPVIPLSDAPTITSNEPVITEDPQETASIIRPAGLPFINTLVDPVIKIPP
jgi:hypothetical protein